MLVLPRLGKQRVVTSRSMLFKAMTSLYPLLLSRFLAGFLLACLTLSCNTTQKRQERRSRAHAFIKYWPPPPGNTALRLAVKDLIDMKGHVTTAGSEYIAKTRAPATRDADCLTLAREQERQGRLQIVGKTNLTEFAVTVSGKNSFFGTPKSRLNGSDNVIPGGSSSGSAVAVATGMADVALGTDTGGSIRVPAACNGIVGLKTTYGLVSTRGVFPISPRHLDTVGPMAKDISHLIKGMELLQHDFAAQYRKAMAEHPSGRSIRIGRLYLDGTDPAIDKAIDEALKASRFKVVKLNPSFKAKWHQADKDGQVVALADAWVNDQQYLDKKGVNTTTKLVIGQGKREYHGEYKSALKRKAAWQRELRRAFQKVDLIAVPTLQQLPPKIPFFRSTVVFEWLVFNMQNTVGVNFAGNPALAVPVSMPPKGKTVPITSLQLVGPRLSEAELLNAGRILEARTR